MSCVHAFMCIYIHTNRTQIEYLYLMSSTHKLNFKLHFRRTIATGNQMHCFSGFHAVPYCDLDHLGAALTVKQPRPPCDGYDTRHIAKRLHSHLQSLSLLGSFAPLSSFQNMPFGQHSSSNTIAIKKITPHLH